VGGEWRGHPDPELGEAWRTRECEAMDGTGGMDPGGGLPAMTPPAFLTGENMMRLLICLYIFTAVLFALQRNWPRMLYWIGAATIATSVLWMK